MLSELRMLHLLLRMIVCMAIISLGIGGGLEHAIEGHVAVFDLSVLYVAFGLFVLVHDHQQMLASFDL